MKRAQIVTSFGNLDVSEWVPVPNHPDLDYQELLGLEDMGESQVTIGKLKLNLNLRQLLDGYEPIEARQRHRRGDRAFDFDDREGMHGLYVNIYQENRDARSKTIHQHGQGDNVAGDRVQGNKVIDNLDATSER